MKRILVLFIVIVLFSVSVPALSPTLEVECCIYIENDEDTYYVNTLKDMCPELNLTKEKCEPVLRGWESTKADFAGSFRGDTYDDYGDKNDDDSYDEEHNDGETIDLFDRIGFSIFALIMLLGEVGFFKFLIIMFIVWLIYKKLHK